MADTPTSEAGQERPLLSDRRFAKLWVLQGISQTAQNAILFTLLIVVLERTGSSTHTSLLILSFILPTILLGMATGVLLDRWRKSQVLVITNAVRSLACVLYLFFHQEVLAIYAISFGFATAGMFFNPAVVALIPAIVRRERLVAANSLYNFTLTGSQLVGMVFLAPAILKGFDEDVLFAVAAISFAVAAALAAALGGVKEGTPTEPWGRLFATIPQEFRRSWQALRADAPAFLAMVQLVMASTFVLLFAILIPRYMKDILNISADNAAFVFAPTGVGAIVGLRFLPWATRRLSKNGVVVVGLAGITLSLVGLSLVQPLAELMRQSGPLNPEERLAGLSLLQALTMIFAGPMGFAYAFLSVPAQTVLHERAPADMRGRIFTTQVVFANFLSLLPVLFIGGLTDLLGGLADLPGITIVLLLIAATAAALATVSARVGGVGGQPEAAAAPPPPEQEVPASVDTQGGG